jgi:protein gp37
MQAMNRIDDLRQVPAAIRFLSCEPLLEPLNNLRLENINWVIVGGESGPKSRPIEKEWIVSIRDKCLKENISFFFKQWGGVIKKKNGRLLEGRTWNEFPDIRAYP